MPAVTKETDRAVRKEYLEYQFHQEDGDYVKHSYRYEQELLDLVRAGNVPKIEENLAAQISPEYPDFIDFNSYKSEEYVVVITICMVSRAAIEAGLTSTDCFKLSDLYLKRVAAAANIQELLAIRDEAILAFTTLVKEMQPSTRTTLYVEECKKYILANIFKKVSVRDVAEALGLNAIYLERVFREAEGVTIGEFVRREKIQRTKNLLVYSDRTILEIAEYLSFSSQSHFGNTFRKETGMTPKQFQLSHRMSGF